MSDTRKVLISGAGIAGPVAAYWLAKAGISVTVVEKSPSLRTNGQTIDIRGVGRDVIDRMGVEQAIRDACTHEEGLIFVDENDVKKASFPVDQENGRSFSCDIEILRGKLAEIFYNVTKDDVEYIFGDCIKGVEDKLDNVSITFASGKVRDFDIVVLSDGMFSESRSLVFEEEKDWKFKSLGQQMAYFSIPYKESDGTWSRWFNAEDSKSILFRPEKETPSSRVYLSVMGDKAKHYRSLDVKGQKKLMRELFTGVGWETPRILDEMDAGAEDFYMQAIGQIKASRWSKGHVVMLGDTAYTPSPISGMGTTCAIVGAYILAGEIATNKDHTVAFKAYDEKLRPFVEKAQKLFPGAPGLAHPQSAFGIKVFHTILGVVSYATQISILQKLGNLLPFSAEKDSDSLYNYKF